MKIKLTPKHKNYNYVGKNEVDVANSDCAKRKCFSPHNWYYTLGNGKIVDSFRCNTREHKGCPE